MTAAQCWALALTFALLPVLEMPGPVHFVEKHPRSFDEAEHATS